MYACPVIFIFTAKLAENLFFNLAGYHGSIENIMSFNYKGSVFQPFIVSLAISAGSANIAHPASIAVPGKFKKPSFFAAFPAILCSFLYVPAAHGNVYNAITPSMSRE